MAAALAEAGARVMVTSRDQARAEATATELGSSAVPCQLDVRDERSVAACIDRARDAWGGFDVLVNGPPWLRTVRAGGRRRRGVVASDGSGSGRHL
jgi:3-oxoacyl-[acyl-carrier protein] reductase